VAGVQPSFVVELGRADLGKVLKLATRGLAVIPRAEDELEWGTPSAADVILSTARLNRVLEHPWLTYGKRGGG